MVTRKQSSNLAPVRVAGIAYLDWMLHASISVAARRQRVPSRRGFVSRTLLARLPVYLYLAGRSPHGLGGGRISAAHGLQGWPGKLLVLLVLAFVATDYV